MFGRVKKEQSKLAEPIDDVLACMKETTPDQEEYPQYLSYLERLRKLEESDKISLRPSADTIVTVLGNLLVVVVIVAYEQKHVMVSKAKDFILKAK